MWDGSIVYDDRYRFEMPPQYLVGYHLKYVKPLDRLRKRYIFPNTPTATKKLDWFNNVYMKWQDDPEGAYAYNAKRGNPGFDTGMTSKLFDYGGLYPKYLEDMS